MLFDKNLFESKYVPAEQRTPVDTLILIGNGFDIWQNLDTSYKSFERYYEAHLDEVLKRFHLKKYIKYNDDGTIAVDSEGNTITYSDVELFYGDPFKPQKLDHTFWWNLETSMDKIDDQQINYFFGRDGVKNIKRCAENAQKILKEMFRDWVATIQISDEISKYAFGDNVLFVNFNYTDTLLKRFGVKEVNEFHIHGVANDKESIIVGHATHPEYPYEPLRLFKNRPRMEGLYYIEEFLYNSDKHIEDNYMKLQMFCGLHGARIENIKKIFVLGLGFGDADLGYIKHLIYETQGISEEPEAYLGKEEKAYLDSLDQDGIMHINMQYAASHRERVMQKKPISFPEYELLDEMIKPYVEDPYQQMERDVQLRLEAAGVRRRFREEQEERNKKMRREYLRMLNKRMHLGILTPVEAFLEHDPRIPYDNSGAEWHISYHNEEDYKQIDAVMRSYGCENYKLYPDIEQCIETFKLEAPGMKNVQ